MLKGRISKLVLIFALIFIAATTVYAADSKNTPVVSSGTMSLSSDEVMRLIASTAGGNEMMASLMLSQSTIEERAELVGQMGDALLFANAGRVSGLESDPDVAFQIKWQTIQILVKAYMDKVGAKWDMSEKASMKFYKEHERDFVLPAAAKTRHILTEKKEEATNAILEIYKTKDFAKVAAERSQDPNSAANGGDLGWVEKGTMTEPVEKAIESARVGQIVGPIESEYGWHVIEVTERRTAKQLEYKEAYNEVISQMQRSYIDAELAKLKVKYPVKIDEKALENIGGIPAAPKQQ